MQMVVVRRRRGHTALGAGEPTMADKTAAILAAHGRGHARLRRLTAGRTRLQRARTRASSRRDASRSSEGPTTPNEHLDVLRKRRRHRAVGWRRMNGSESPNGDGQKRQWTAVRGALSAFAR